MGGTVTSSYKASSCRYPTQSDDEPDHFGIFVVGRPVVLLLRALRKSQRFHARSGGEACCAERSQQAPCWKLHRSLRVLKWWPKTRQVCCHPLQATSKTTTVEGQLQAGHVTAGGLEDVAGKKPATASL